MLYYRSLLICRNKEFMNSERECDNEDCPKKKYIADLIFI